MVLLNFSSVAEIIIQYTGISITKTKVDFIYALFNSFFKSPFSENYVVDDSVASRWLNGKRDISSEIKAFYNNNHKQDMRNDIEKIIVPEMFDYDKAIQEIKKILLADISISQKKKNAMLEKYSSDENSAIDFLTEILFFVVSRNNLKTTKSIKTSEIILNCDVPKPCKYFYGRSNEIEKLNVMLSENKKIFIQGIAGIGKSEFVKFYAKNFKNEYTNILYFAYTGNLKNDIADMHFIDDQQDKPQEELFNNHFKFLQTLEDDSLIIIDNFDTTADKEKLLNEMLKLKCKIIFTTRCRFDKHNTFYLYYS